MLKLSNIQKKFYKAIVLNNISFKIPTGAIAGVIGPNGAGKSTILKIITGFETCDSGTIYFNEKEITSFDEKMKLFSYMPEQLDIYPDYYVQDFINFIQKTTNFKNDDLVYNLNLSAVKNKKIRNLSKGYKQRLKLFVGLSNNKPIVVLDEPFDGFDPIKMQDILELIKHENKNGRTFLVSTHQLYDAEKLCDYYIFLNEGKVVADGTLEKLKNRFGDSTNTLEQIFISAL